MGVGRGEGCGFGGGGVRSWEGDGWWWCWRRSLVEVWRCGRRLGGRSRDAGLVGNKQGLGGLSDLIGCGIRD